jgi:hypothetical protein
MYPGLVLRSKADSSISMSPKKSFYSSPAFCFTHTSELIFYVVKKAISEDSYEDMAFATIFTMMKNRP